MATGMYPLGIVGTFSSPLWRIHPVSVPVNCLGYRFLPVSVPVGHRSGNRYPMGTVYPINKDTWGHSFTIGDVSSSPGYKCRSLGDAEEKERGCEVDEQRWQRDRTEEARGTSAREAGVLVLLAEMVRKIELGFLEHTNYIYDCSDLGQNIYVELLWAYTHTTAQIVEFPNG